MSADTSTPAPTDVHSLAAGSTPVAAATGDLHLPAAEQAALDEAVQALHAGSARWAALTPRARAALLREVHAAIATQREAWALTAADLKGLTPGSPLVGEEWISGPYATLSSVSLLITSLDALADGASPVPAKRLGTAPGNRVSVQVQPLDARESLLLNGIRTEVWFEPGVSAEQVRAAAGLGSRPAAARGGVDGGGNGGENGGVGLVLGAGNITSIAPLDALYELVANNRTVILKLNPTMDPLFEVYQAALAPLVREGYLRIVRGGVAVGSYLARHDLVAHVHITGSNSSHDAVVWGVGEDAARRRAAGTPLLTKPITSELGGVCPIIVVPGRWSARDLRFQAEHVATQRLHNSGHNCIAGQLLVLSSDWPQKEQFLAVLREVLATLPARTPWYPGTATRTAAAQASYPQAQEIGGRLLVSLSVEDADEFCVTEYFGPVLGVVELPGTGEAFLQRSVDFANDRLAGTLGANLIVAPRDRRAIGARFEELLADLRYGSIAVNAWTAQVFLASGAPWGAFPGHTVEDAGSGVGVVHNALLLDRTERTVIQGPFRPFPRSVVTGELTLMPKPPWFVTARTAAATGRALAAYAAKPSWLKLPGIVASALRG